MIPFTVETQRIHLSDYEVDVIYDLSRDDKKNNLLKPGDAPFYRAKAYASREPVTRVSSSGVEMKSIYAVLHIHEREVVYRHKWGYLGGSLYCGSPKVYQGAEKIKQIFERLEGNLDKGRDVLVRNSDFKNKILAYLEGRRDISFAKLVCEPYFNVEFYPRGLPPST